tara:strand:- start:2517 stop:2789 length:273 start_codon:yes stop_codon:yes gene_type:complete
VLVVVLVLDFCRRRTRYVPNNVGLTTAASSLTPSPDVRTVDCLPAAANLRFRSFSRDAIISASDFCGATGAGSGAGIGAAAGAESKPPML